MGFLNLLSHCFWQLVILSISPLLSSVPHALPTLLKDWTCQHPFRACTRHGSLLSERALLQVATCMVSASQRGACVLLAQVQAGPEAQQPSPASTCPGLSDMLSSTVVGLVWAERVHVKGLGLCEPALCLRESVTFWKFQSCLQKQTPLLRKFSV